MSATWGEITVQEVATAIGGRQITGSPNEPVKGLSTDSRNMAPGHLFLALKGERYNGHDFVAQAIGAGAAGAIVESDSTLPPEAASVAPVIISVPSTLKALGDLAAWWRRQWGGKVVAITGSNGKSTTKELASSILSLKARTLKSPGNFNNLIGLPLTILSLQEDHEMAVLEMGMNTSGEIARLTRIADPTVGLITNVGQAHLEGLGDLEGVIEAKAELLKTMSGGATAILNGDDEPTARLIPLFQGPVVTFGLGKANRVRAGGIRKLGEGTQSFTIYVDGERIPVRINLQGIHNVINALGGAAIATCMSLSGEMIARGLEDFRPLKGRFQMIGLNGGITIIDDTYNSNPSSLRAAVQAIEELKVKGRELVIGLGEMMELGKESAQHHFDAGMLIARSGARYLVVLGEHGARVIEGAREGGMESAQTHLATDHAEMIEAIKARVREGGMVLLKGSRRVALDRVVEVLKGYYGVRQGERHAL